MPPIHSGTCREVRATYSIAANFTGWSCATARAAVSPTKIWNGVITAAGTNPIANPVEW